MNLRMISPFEDCNPENDNLDVHIRPDDGGGFNLLAATPNNIFWRMDNAGVDDYFGTPPLLVRLLDRHCLPGLYGEGSPGTRGGGWRRLARSLRNSADVCYGRVVEDPASDRFPLAWLLTAHFSTRRSTDSGASNSKSTAPSR
jgi:hypothetical protein